MTMLSKLAGKYGSILIDPPWSFKTYSPKGAGRSAVQHYDCMTFQDIKDIPINQLSLTDCVIFLWVTDPMLQKGLELIEAWGFTYKTVGFYWVKTNLRSDTWFTGLGYWTRANPEQCLLATKGKPLRKAKDIPRLIVDHRREHSRKPSCVHDRIERLVSGPYLELFARASVKGWDTWGAEAGKFDP